MRRSLFKRSRVRGSLVPAVFHRPDTGTPAAAGTDESVHSTSTTIDRGVWTMICSTPPGFGPDLIGMFSGFVAYGRRGRGGASLQSKPPHLTFRAANGVPP